jgi:hypothetical protein
VPGLWHNADLREHGDLVRRVPDAGGVDAADGDSLLRLLRLPEQLGIVEEPDDRGHDLTVEEEMLLGDPAADAQRVAWLVARVAAAADRLEEALWAGRDAGTEFFKAALADQDRMESHVERA